MKKEILLPALAWIAGGVGFVLRQWELASALDPDTLLFSPHPSTALLLALTAVMLLAAAVLSRGSGRREMEPWLRFQAPVTGYILLIVCAALLLFGAAGAGAVEFVQSLTVRLDPILGVLCILCLCSGPCVLSAGRGAYRRRWNQNTPMMFVLTAFCMLVWLVATYQQQSRQPELLVYLYQLMAVIAVLLSLYGMSSMSLEKGGTGTCTAGLMSIYLSLVTLADGHGLCFTLLYLFAALYLTAQMYLLLHAAFGQPWPERMPGWAEDEEEAEDQTDDAATGGPEPTEN